MGAFENHIEGENLADATLYFPLRNNTKVWKSQRTSQDHNTLEKMSSFVSKSMRMITDTFPIYKQWISKAQF